MKKIILSFMTGVLFTAIVVAILLGQITNVINRINAEHFHYNYDDMFMYATDRVIGYEATSIGLGFYNFVWHIYKRGNNDG